MSGSPEGIEVRLTSTLPCFIQRGRGEAHRLARPLCPHLCLGPSAVARTPLLAPTQAFAAHLADMSRDKRVSATKMDRLKELGMALVEVSPLSSPFLPGRPRAVFSAAPPRQGGCRSHGPACPAVELGSAAALGLALPPKPCQHTFSPGRRTAGASLVFQRARPPGRRCPRMAGLPLTFATR
jgi:hypothetical protein